MKIESLKNVIKLFDSSFKKLPRKKVILRSGNG